MNYIKQIIGFTHRCNPYFIVRLFFQKYWQNDDQVSGGLLCQTNQISK